jgi:hypothetical protein
MADNLGTLFVKIDAETKDFNKKVDQSEKRTNDVSKSVTGMAKSLKTMFAGLGLALVASKLAEVAKASIDAASDAEETQNKFNVVFSSMADDANDMAVALADSYGTSITGAKDMLAGTGDLLTGLGFTQTAALDLSTQVLSLGSDLASFTNFSGGAEGASEALTKALLGERESLKALGISINEADLKAEVLRQTENGLTFATEKQAKANATLTLVMAQSKNAMGDFERSQDSFANQTKIAEAAVSDLKVEIGRAMLPAATIATSAFGELTSAVADFIRESNNLAEAEKAIEEGTDTANQRLLILEDETKELNLQLKIKKSSFEDLKKTQQLAEIDQKVFIKQISLLEGQIAVKDRIRSLIIIEINDKQRLLDLTEEERLAEEELEKQRQAKYDAGVLAVTQQDLLIQKVIENAKTELDIIDDQIAAITKVSLADGTYRDDQLIALEALQADKQAIFDAEAEAKQKAIDDELKLEEEKTEKLIELEKKRAEDAEANRLARIDNIQAEFDFVTGIAESLNSIWENSNVARLEEIESEKNATIEGLDEELLGTEEYNRLKTEAEQTAADDAYDIKLAEFNANKALALTQIAIDTAIGVAKVYGQTGIFGLGAQVPVIAMGLAQAAVVGSQQPPPKPQLATGAIIPGSQRGVDVTVGERGNEELILGGGSQGEAILNRFADKVNARGGGGQTIININSLYPPRQQDLDRLSKDLYTGNIKEQQRRGIN